MNSWDIIQVLGVPLVAWGSYKLGFNYGWNLGSVEGRKAVREYYEQVGR